MALLERIEKPKPKDAVPVTVMTLFSVLKDMRENKEFTDIVLICDGGNFAAHRNILSARSPYFKKMFQSNFKESATGEVDFSHVTKDIMQVILDYVYLFTFKDISVEKLDDLIKIVQISHLFELKELTEHYGTLMLNAVNLENWFNIWNVVLHHECDLDVHRLHKFIIVNLSKIAEKKEFLNLTHSQMMTIFSKLKERNTPIEDCFMEGFLKWWSVNNTHNDEVQDALLNLNFDFVSKECMNKMIEDENSKFLDKAYKKVLKLQVLPKLNRKMDLDISMGTASPSIVKLEDVPLKFFFFGCYRKEYNSCYVYRLAYLRIFDCMTNSLSGTDELPFQFCNDVIPIQCGADIYIISSAEGVATPLTSHPLKSFFLYDWKANSITAKPPLPLGVNEPLTYVIKENIYVLDYDEDKKECFLQFFNISEQKWYSTTKWKIPKVVACIMLKDTLYLFCWNTKEYFLYTANNNKCSFHFNTPIEPDYDDETHTYKNVIYQNGVAVMKGQIVVNTNSFTLFIYNPETKLWNFLPCFTIDYRSYFFTAENDRLMFYNKDKQKLYYVNKDVLLIEDVMSIKSSFRNDKGYKDYGFSKYENILIYRE